MEAYEAKEIVNRKWPDWIIIDELGHGSYAHVYKAVRNDMSGVSYAAIKIIRHPEKNSAIDEYRKRGYSDQEIPDIILKEVKDCTAEIRLMESLKGYTNIATIEDYTIYHPEGELFWYILIRMELLNSLDMKSFWENGRLNEEKLLKLGIDLCKALDVCKKFNIVHRDINPNNIFVNITDDYKLGDFGIAKSLKKAVKDDDMPGMPYYMAPEIFSNMDLANAPAALKMDIYSMGMVLYEIANGLKLPFLKVETLEATYEEKKEVFIRRAINGENIPPLNISPGLDKAIRKACTFRPEDRYDTAEEMLEDLLKLQQPGDVPEGKGVGRYIVLALLAVAAIVGIIICFNHRKTPEMLHEITSGFTEGLKLNLTQVPEPTPEPTSEPTPEPTPEPTSEPTPEPTPVPSLIPVSFNAKLLDSLSARSGPSTQYTNKYYDMKGDYVSVLARAEDVNQIIWINIEYTYNGELRRGYTGSQRLDISDSMLDTIPKEESPQIRETGIIISDINPKWGPGDQYGTYKDQLLKSGTYVEIVNAENGYFAVEIEYADKDNNILRCWVPLDAVRIP